MEEPCGSAQKRLLQYELPQDELPQYDVSGMRKNTRATPGPP